MLSKKLTISPQEANQMMAAENNFVLLDVRTREEYSQIHIDGAELLPVDEIERLAGSRLPDKNALILIYCHSGMRAGSAAKMLTRMGYINAFSFGGIINWPYKTVKG